MTDAPSAAPRRSRWRVRSVAAVVAILVGALLAPPAVVAAWARGVVDDTDRWVATVGPLAADPAVQDAVVERVTRAIVTGADLERLVADATGAVAALDLPPVATTAVETLRGPLVVAATDVVRQTVTRVVTSERFSTLWVEANRAVHARVLAVLRGDPGALAAIGADGALSVDLAPVVDAARTALVDRGFTVLERLPAIDATFVLVRSPELVRVQSAYRALDAAGTWLPFFSLGLLAVGVVLARRRARALVAAGLALGAGMVVLALVLWAGERVYVSSLPGTVQRPDVAVVVYDQVVSLLRVALRSGLVLGLVVAAVAFLAGGSGAARALRASWARAVAAVRRAGDRQRISTGPAGELLHQQRVLVRVVVACAAGLVLTLAEHLTPGLVLWTAAGAAGVLLAASLLGRPGPAATPPPD
ncbi:hypothetical protein [Cellulomonas sp.]|uniref:hypothetical protein n=1 Tax=Cellulomonas sp. TaxID=40001 RepID=UPI0025879229|nr:hypothetical protein [Cellulomonas sp.]MCR6690315.1 hypothetical protein [Cellulomonas sp.]